jgi:bleomycin hydrolase
MNQKYSKFLVLAIILFVMLPGANAQDSLINALKDNQSENARNFKFTTLIDLETTSVKDQKTSGTCWSFSTNSFLESEMIRMGKEPVNLANLFTARNAYIDKGTNYVRMHGAVNLGDGGSPHDVINMYAKYGALPQEVYSGNHYGTMLNTSERLNRVTKSILDKVVRNNKGRVDTAWKKEYSATIDASMGAVPASFDYKGKTYTPKSFAIEVVGLNPKDYVGISSFNNVPYYEQSVLMVPDNWSFDKVYNVKLNDLTDIVDFALKNGFTVAWAADITEKSFSWKNGIAVVPPKDYENLSKKEKSDLFNGPQQEMDISPVLRQESFDNYRTTDDHGMQIVGLATDQNGKAYYRVKNSWGTGNDFKGFIYVTKAYFKYKTTSILLNKNGIPANISELLKLK